MGLYRSSHVGFERYSGSAPVLAGKSDLMSPFVPARSPEAIHPRLPFVRPRIPSPPPPPPPPPPPLANKRRVAAITETSRVPLWGTVER